MAFVLRFGDLMLVSNNLVGYLLWPIAPNMTYWQELWKVGAALVRDMPRFGAVLT